LRRQIIPTDLPRLTGRERFSNGDAVLDFWRWGLGDLRMNNARGYLVEYLVARAVGATAPLRVEWAGWDVEAPDGTRIEVKSSAYLQSWRQAQPSRPKFILSGADSNKAWDDAMGRYVEMPDGRVHVWVFALHTCRDPALYDPLDLSTWRFWAVAHSAVAALGQKSATLSTIERLADPVGLDGLAEAVRTARAG
jgi:hypothetical protein